MDIIFFKRGERVYRVINRVEFLGSDWLICQMASAASGHHCVESIRADTVTREDEVAAETWEAAEKVAVKAKEDAEQRAAFLWDAERYGVHVTAKSDRTTWRTTIVRVTRTRYVDAHGAQWIRGGFRNGVRVGPGVYSYLVDTAEIETRCGKADTFDFIKAGKAAEKASK